VRTPSVKVTATSVKATILSLKVRAPSVKVAAASLKVRTLSVKATALSLKVTTAQKIVRRLGSEPKCRENISDTCVLNPD